MTVLELVLDDVVGLGLGLCFGGGGDLRSGIAAFALTAVTADRVRTLDARARRELWRCLLRVVLLRRGPDGERSPKRDDHNQRDQSQSSPRYAR